MGKTDWAKSTNGPDWTDVAMLMSAIGTLHTCRVALAITVPTAGHNGGIHMCATAKFDTLPGSDLPKEVTSEGDWPSGRSATFAGAAYACVFALDYRISQAYEQMVLNP
jgi:hypothetical protein